MFFYVLWVSEFETVSVWALAISKGSTLGYRTRNERRPVSRSSLTSRHFLPRPRREKTNTMTSKEPTRGVTNRYNMNNLD